MAIALPSWLLNNVQTHDGGLDARYGGESNVMTLCIRLDKLSRQQIQSLQPAIDYLGAESAKAQSITQPMTSVESLQNASRKSDRLYFIAQGTSGTSDVAVYAFGFLRVGIKHLFLEVSTMHVTMRLSCATFVST
eukprot:gb/GECG01002803.1/.p1 GENE.gb/GECG01002803.1/~~gb/GECG01002803.1/.p1  ORF type:complete len:135 (+),score=10.88 gb/GECG01002803.1/:1-405(+)